MKKENRIKGQETTTTDRSEDFYKKMYGENVVITRLGRISIVHLDHPSPQIIEKRIQEVLWEEMTGEAWEDTTARYVKQREPSPTTSFTTETLAQRDFGIRGQVPD